MTRRDDLLVEIAREEARLAGLHAETAACFAILAALRKEADSAMTSSPVQAPSDNAAKIALFRSLFRGRDDVFPRRWENPKTGRSGYSPACANEWDHGLCWKKPAPDGTRRGSCGDCPNQAFTPVSDEEVRKHLRGDCVMGVYAMLKDETCWFWRPTSTSMRGRRM